jgi:rubrerythrin
MAPRPKTTRFWLDSLVRRRPRIDNHAPYAHEPLTFASDAERASAIRFFNAAIRAEESGFQKAYELADRLGKEDSELGQVLRLYGDEERWHHDLLSEFLPLLGGQITKMGKVTGSFYRLYAHARRTDTILLTNLMFETIGATTYRLALETVEQPSARAMLKTLARDEAFHVPLNVHFLRQSLANQSRVGLKTRFIFHALWTSLLLLPWASRPKAQAFDKLEAIRLSRAYHENLKRVFANTPELGLAVPAWPDILFSWAQKREAYPLPTRG